MLIYILLIIIVITQTYSSSTDHSQNKIVRRKTDYKVNISMVDDDIEMDRKFIHLSNRTSKLSKNYKKSHSTLQYRSLDSKNKIVMNPKATKPSHNTSRDMYQNNSSIRSNYGDAKSEEKSEKTPRIWEIDVNKTVSGGDRTNLTRAAREISPDRVWSIIQIWLLIYIVLAIPLWCTIGRCCCCLVCKCFKAQETIREAKLYAMWNPPGVLRKSAGDVLYTPSEREKEAYEELEHLIRTL
ncbi:uncharacterized protein LOC133528655 [Cydia pomonella]|uniref:uncharacterized protein LOC133528655 n=1 Tax=Cydia pomonella TaxID=82600 RepID=UPI002ADE039D|nr:uncharacterized protein LOC133528655 [Cydia pomonella]